MKLYYGGCGQHKVFVVANDAADAVQKIGVKINAPFLPVALEEISEVDGFEIRPFADVLDAPCEATPVENENAEIETPDETPVEADKPATLRHCKKCDFTCESQGELLAHYRECHPKGA